jgi:hypothetical protein
MNQAIPQVNSAGPSVIFRTSFYFLCVFIFIFIEQTAFFWHHGDLLAGTHADGPFHYSCELLKLNPESFPGDIAIQSNRNFGAYEYFYSFVAAFTKATGLSLLNGNLVLCWLANFLYLAGVMFLLRRLGARPVWAAIGMLLAAQPFVLVGMSSGVVHSLAIPREVWQWPLPWFVTWFLFGKRAGWHLLIFYGAIGAMFAFTYPLWAVLLGVGFGLADAAFFLREKKFTEIFWLGAAGLVCMALVAIPSLATYRAVAAGDGAVLDYNQITRSVYFSKGFRLTLVFVAAGLGSFWLLRRTNGELSEPLRRLRILLLASLAVCVFFEPLQRLLPNVSLLYPGRLSLVAYLASMMAVALALDAAFQKFPCWGKALAVAAILAVCLSPIRSLQKEVKTGSDGSVAAQEDFVAFCKQVRQKTPANILAIAPPLPGAHYFRVYAERSLWISGKDTGVLSRSRKLYDEGNRRLKILQQFYDGQTSPPQREIILQTLKLEGVNYIVVEEDEKWTASLSWPVIFQNGKWQLRAATANVP